MKNYLYVNTSILDMVSAKPETTELYDNITGNCSICLTSEKTSKLLSQGNITINAATTIKVDMDDTDKIITLNGFKNITAEFSKPSDPTSLIVNGALLIEDSNKKQLDQYKNVIVNGVIILPYSFDTSNFHVNGTLIPYPDGATLIFQELELTNSFIKSAIPNTTYCVLGIPDNINNLGDMSMDKIGNLLKNSGVKALEPLDLKLLKDKNIHFDTSWLTTLEENAEALAEIVSGNVCTTIIPAGYKLMPSGILDVLSVAQFGKKIYVDGDLTIYAEDAKALAAVEELYVTGNVHIDDSLINIFLEKHPKYKELLTFSGELIDIKDMEFCVDNKFLKNINTCATLNILNSNVEISPEVSLEIISEKIHKIYLNDSTLTIGLNQQNILRRKIHNTNGDVLLREFENTEEIAPNEPYKKDFIETRVNSSYYKL